MCYYLCEGIFSMLIYLCLFFVIKSIYKYMLIVFLIIGMNWLNNNEGSLFLIFLCCNCGLFCLSFYIKVFFIIVYVVLLIIVSIGNILVFLFLCRCKSIV